MDSPWGMPLIFEHIYRLPFLRRFAIAFEKMGREGTKKPPASPEALKSLELVIGLEPTTCSLRIFLSMKSTHKMEIYTVFSALYT